MAAKIFRLVVPRRWGHWVTALCLSAATTAVFADGNAAQSCAVFCGARDQLGSANLTPIRQLDDPALFAAAAAMRDKNMPATQRLINHSWLHETSATRIQGSKVWSRLLRQSLSAYNMRQGAAEDEGWNWLDEGWGDPRTDYRLRISEDRVRLLVRYDF